MHTRRNFMQSMSICSLVSVIPTTSNAIVPLVAGIAARRLATVLIRRVTVKAVQKGVRRSLSKKASKRVVGATEEITGFAADAAIAMVATSTVAHAMNKDSGSKSVNTDKVQPHAVIHWKRGEVAEINMTLSNPKPQPEVGYLHIKLTDAKTGKVEYQNYINVVVHARSASDVVYTLKSLPFVGKKHVFINTGLSNEVLNIAVI